MDSVAWLAPVDPPVMRDCLTFEEHLVNAWARRNQSPPEQYYKAPAYYKGNPQTLIGHESESSWPGYADDMDYELELGFVIGRDCQDLTPDEAEACVFGFTIFNDFSARSYQAGEMTSLLGPAKGKDFCTAVGPWVTTTDELDYANLEMIARVNGEEWSRGTSAGMIWSVPEIVAYISMGERVTAGDVIASGTVGGGCGLELERRLNSGDVVELEVSGLGVLRNTIGQRQESRWAPTPRERRLGLETA